MRGAEIALGPGRVELLESIEEMGSLRLAAKQMGVSYMRAWKLVKLTNRCFREPLVEVSRGGRTGGGARLTDAGRRLRTLYRSMERKCHHAVRADWNELRNLLSK
jgi:molybdate transport system regulatory protein